MRIFFLFLTIVMLPISSYGQHFFRIRGDYSQKIKTADGSNQLIMGRFFYDENIGKIVYDNYFPDNEIWVTTDTALYKIVNDEIKGKTPIPAIHEFSIFHLALNNQLEHYGLKKSLYAISSVDREGDMVISTWVPPSTQKSRLGKIMLSNKNNRLFGIVFFDPAGSVVRKQFFEDYKNFGGLQFPQKLVEILHINGKENHQITTYKNIVIDELSSENYYDYPVPGYN